MSRRGSIKKSHKDSISNVGKQKLHLGVNTVYSLKIKNHKSVSSNVEDNKKQIIKKSTKRSNSLLTAGTKHSLDHSNDENKEN